MNKCIFLDRDGVLNRDKVDYVYTLEEHIILDGVIEALKAFKKEDYLLVIITNQSGIAKGLYSREEVFICYEALQKQCDHLIDGIYYCPYHPSVTESLARKPGSLMFEKAIARYDIDVTQSWMVGDKERDLVPAKKLGIKTVLVNSEERAEADYITADLLRASQFILKT